LQLTQAIYRYINKERGRKNFFVSVSFVEVNKGDSVSFLFSLHFISFQILDDQLTDTLNPHSNSMTIRENPQLGMWVLLINL
jgi:hypothetical protein